MSGTTAYGTDPVAGEPEPQLTPNAMAVLERRYLQRNEAGKVIETPKELFWRVARNLAEAEALYGADKATVDRWASEFYRLMASLEFLPNSPTLMNAGLPLQQLSACFVLPVNDSLTGIFDTLKHQALIHQSGGGTGFSFSRLRPKGDVVRSTMGVASGPVSFMKIFDAATQTVKQGGKRRGANMGILRVDHPDILDFVTCKDDLSQVTNFNISVAVTDKFMEAVRKGESYNLLNPRTKQVAGQMDAREVFDKIARQAWKNGEPGLFFLDITNATNPCPHIADFEATNPCVTGDTFVSTAQGLVPIRELAGRGPVEIDVDVRAGASESSLLQLGTTRSLATRVWKTGVRLVFRLVTRLGYSVKATSDHRFLTPDGWRSLERLQPGDTVLIRSGEDKVVAIEPLGEEEVYDLSEPRTHSFIANGFVTHNCGEQPLLPYESCNLGSLNLEKVVKAHGAKAEVDWEHLERNIRSCVRLLDNVIDQNAYPVKEIEDMTKKTRKIGLGVMGFARLLFRLGLRYDSEEGVAMGRRVMKFIRDTGYDESQKLAKEKGPYPAWPGSRHHKMGLLMRNSYVTTVAPTGTLSMIADTSGGCEPEFSLLWYKNVMDGTHLPYVLDYFIEVAKREGWWREDLLDKILKNGGRARGVPEIPKKWQEAFAVSFDVSPEWHVRMQAAYQEGSDSAVSKTINLPATATVEDVKKAYLLAYELKCKGITVYRDGSRNDQVLNVGVSQKGKGGAAKRVEASASEVPQVLKPRPRPDTIMGRTQKVLTGYGALYVTINEDDQGLFEVFAQTGRGGGYTASFTESIARLVSLCLRSGVPVEEIIDQLEGIRSPRITMDHRERIFSIPDAIAKALKRHVGAQPAGVQASVDHFPEEAPPGNGHVDVDDELEHESLSTIVRNGLNPECPECGRVLTYEEGCVKCLSCGYSEC